MEGNTPTKISTNLRLVNNATVIKFIDNPTYRNFDLDVSNP